AALLEVDAFPVRPAVSDGRTHAQDLLSRYAEAFVPGDDSRKPAHVAAIIEARLAIPTASQLPQELPARPAIPPQNASMHRMKFPQIALQIEQQPIVYRSTMRLRGTIGRLHSCMRKTLRIIAIACWPMLAAGVARAADAVPDHAGVEFFESKIRPI